jgi:uncharacterized protein HemY
MLRHDFPLIAAADFPTCQSRDQAMQRLLIGIGVALVLAGIAWPLLSRIGLGRLPGDIMIRRGSTSFYFPLATCIIISVVLSALMWLFNR